MSPQKAAAARSGAQIVLSEVRVVRGGETILDGVDLAVSHASRIGVVGENGRGKSTLLNVLAGMIQPDSGEVRRIGSVGLAEQEIPINDVLTVGELIDVELTAERSALADLDEASGALSGPIQGADEAYAAALARAVLLDAWDADRRVDVALEALGATGDRARPLSTLSVGQRYRVRLACLLGASHDFLLLDEPTNHLDDSGLDFLGAALSTTRAGVVLVSHDRVLLREVVADVIDLDPSIDGRPRRFGGGYDAYVEGRTSALARWAQEHDHHRTEELRLKNDLSAAQNRLQSGWRPPKGTGKHQRATRSAGTVRSVHRRLSDLDAHRASAPPTPLVLRAPAAAALPGVALVRADGVRVDGRLHDPVSLELSSGDRLLVLGPNGTGKSTLLSVLAGEMLPTDGEVRISPTARIVKVAQESSFSSDEPVRSVFEGEMRRRVASGEAASDSPSLSSLGLLSARAMSRRVDELSMGQRRRLDLAIGLAARPHLLLLDEPTNHLSIALVDELADAFDATSAAVVIATHDRWLRHQLRGWSNQVLAGAHDHST